MKWERWKLVFDGVEDEGGCWRLWVGWGMEWGGGERRDGEK